MTASQAIVQALQPVLNRLTDRPYPHVPNPAGCKKRASVAVIIRVRPAFAPLAAPTQSTVNVEEENACSSIDSFFSQSWVHEGDAEVLFIKRAGRAGDRWSGHTALPGGKRDLEDADDKEAAIRETREEIGLDLSSSQVLSCGGLPQRIVATTWGKEPLMVLCPFLFLVSSKTVPALQPQPTEVASAHWVSLRALLSPSLRTLEKVDISSRMAGRHHGSVLVRWLLRFSMGKMIFSAIKLVPSESVYASSVPGFIPDDEPVGPVSGWAQAPFGVPESTKSLAFQQPILLWGLTLGILADFLDTLPPYNAVALWRYPTFTAPDLRFLVWLFTYSLRKGNAGDLSAGTWPSNTAADATTQAVTVTEAEPVKLIHQQHGRKEKEQPNTSEISSQDVRSKANHAVARLLVGYYERVNVAITVFLLYRVILGAGVTSCLYRAWRRRRSRL